MSKLPENVDEALVVADYGYNACYRNGYEDPEHAWQAALAILATEVERLRANEALLMLALSDNECPEESPQSIEDAIDIINGLWDHNETLRETNEMLRRKLDDSCPDVGF